MTTELATHEENPLALLGRMDLASIDPDKVEKLLALQERWEDRQATKAHAAALVAFQSEMPPILKERQVQRKYYYANYDDIMRVARPILQKHGLAISASQKEDEKSITITVRVTHKEGHFSETPVTMPKLGVIKTRDGDAATNEAQAMGSSIMYARRNALCLALDIVVTDEDDDAQAAGAGPLITAEQAKSLNDSLAALEAAQEGGAQRFIAWVGCDVAQIPAARFAECELLLAAKLKNLKKGGAK